MRHQRRAQRRGRGDLRSPARIGRWLIGAVGDLRFPLAFDGALLGQVVRIFVDTVDGWYRRRHVERGLPPGETGAVAVIQRANSDLRLNPHIHAVCLDGVYSADREGARNARGVGRGRCGPEVPEGETAGTRCSTWRLCPCSKRSRPS
jgi:hypothetical protein